jgi:hypothetical protein
MATLRIYDWTSTSTISRLNSADIAKALGQPRGIVDKWLDSKPIQDARTQADEWQKKNKQRAFPLIKNVSLAVYESTTNESLKAWIEHCEATAHACRPLLVLEEDQEIQDEDLKSMARIIEVAYHRSPVPGAKPPPVTPKPKNRPKTQPVTAVASPATGGKSTAQATPATPRNTTRPGEDRHVEGCNFSSDADWP